MNTHWKSGLFRIVIVLAFLVMVLYELITRENLFRSYFTWNNGLLFTLKIIIIPAALIYLIVWTINWCRIGFQEPKRKINWREGGDRLAAALGLLLLIGFFIWMWVLSESLVKALFALAVIIVPLAILGGIVYWVGEGFKKSNKKRNNG